VNAAKAYEVVNAGLALVGQAPITAPSDGTDRQKIEFLFNTYVARLKRAVPEYRKLKDDRLIPDMGVAYLVSVLDGKK